MALDLAVVSLTQQTVGSGPTLAYRRSLSPNEREGVMFWIEKAAAPLLMHVYRHVTDRGDELLASPFDSTTKTFTEPSVRPIAGNEYDIDLAFGGDKLYVTSTSDEPKEIKLVIIPMTNGTLPSDRTSDNALIFRRKHLVTLEGSTFSSVVIEPKDGYSDIDFNEPHPVQFATVTPEGRTPTSAFRCDDLYCFGLSLNGDSVGVLEKSFNALKLSVPNGSYVPPLVPYQFTSPRPC
ncbi:unnamed protein product [Mortierella alpina]